METRPLFGRFGTRGEVPRSENVEQYLRSSVRKEQTREATSILTSDFGPRDVVVVERDELVELIVCFLLLHLERGGYKSEKTRVCSYCNHRSGKYTFINGGRKGKVPP